MRNLLPDVSTKKKFKRIIAFTYLIDGSIKLKKSKGIVEHRTF